MSLDSITRGNTKWDLCIQSVDITVKKCAASTPLRSGGLRGLTSRQDNVVSDRPGRLKQKSFISKDRDTGVCIGSNLPFSLICLSLERNTFRKGKGIKFWIERLIINSIEELNSRGNRLQG